MSGINRRTLIAGTGALAGLGSAATLASTRASAAPDPTTPMLSADRFGAKGDGRSDDTAALQKALDRAFAGDKAAYLRIPPGAYRITRTLRIATVHGADGNITRGNGILAHGAVILSDIRDGSPVIRLVNEATLRFTVIEGLGIQGNGGEGAGLSIDSGRRGTYFYNFCLRDLTVQGCGGTGLELVGNVFEGQVFNSYFRDNKGNGAVFSHGPENTVLSAVHVFGCVFGGNREQGALIANGAADVGFHGCYFLLNGKFGLAATNGCTLLSNCGFENNHQSAANFAAGDAGLRLLNFGTLVGCTAYSIYRQTHLVSAYVTGELTMIGCRASGGGAAKEAKLAKLAGRPDAGIALIGCSGGVDRAAGLGAVELGTGGAGARFGAAWNGADLIQLGTYRLWVDAKGRLRIKNGPPHSDEDGTPLGA
ncbi:MAG TPA: glycosyl hydrolase family 28-related protein [Alphaproteobacteria bacterium]|nr:glycosyl hydrolase family 28-related protein [Alphaproteobacteria bacterium]